MVNREREKVGGFVVTSDDNLDPEYIVCAHCQAKLSRYHKETDAQIPSCEELVESGAIAVPNFGWFCGPSCAKQYEVEFDVRFARTESGQIGYD